MSSPLAVLDLATWAQSRTHEDWQRMARDTADFLAAVTAAYEPGMDEKQLERITQDLWRSAQARGEST